MSSPSHPNNVRLALGSTRLSEWSELDQAAPTFIPRGAHILHGACVDGIGMGKMHEHRMHDWGFDAEPEESVNGREIEAMRGKQFIVITVVVNEIVSECKTMEFTSGLGIPSYLFDPVRQATGWGMLLDYDHF